MKWKVVYEKAIREDGSLFFPERLTEAYLYQQKRTQGSYIFANQYQNEIVPSGEQPFRKEWLRYYAKLPEIKNTFAFIDPALSEGEHSDFTALTIIDVDANKKWYLRLAQRYRINPTQIMDLIFKLNDQFQPMQIGIEDVAFQKALLYMMHEEMLRRNKMVPIIGVKPSTRVTKEMRILGLIPRFEWGNIELASGLNDFEMEYSQFPRSSHDDLLDSLQYMEQIVTYPTEERFNYENLGPNHPEYEKWYRRKLEAGLRNGSDEDY